jgi:peroxiredoxin family protein
MAEEKKRKVSMVVFSGDMDKLMAAFIIATGAAAAGFEVIMFFTFWGLRALKAGPLTGTGFFGRMMGIFYGGGIDKANPSKYGFGGIGRWMFKKMMKEKKVTPLAELRRTAIDLGVNLLACQMSMDVMGIKREDLIDEVTDVVGAATYCHLALQGKTLFI